MNYLLPIDGSSASLAAVHYLCQFVGLLREAPQVHLLNVQPLVSGNARQFIHEQDLKDYHREEGLAALLAARKLLDQAGVPYQFHILVGHAAETIVNFAKQHACTHIIIGHRGKGAPLDSLEGWKELLLGSVANEVISHSPLPVTAVKAGALAADGSIVEE